MTNKQKSELRQLAKEGLSFKQIRGIMDWPDATIRCYLKLFSPKNKINSLLLRKVK